MRLTIFWRMILAQLALIALIVVVNFYALSQLNGLASLSAEIVARDSAAIEEEKRLLRIFLGQIRSAEKYVLLQDQVFYDHFRAGNKDFDDTVEKINALIDNPREKALLAHIKDLYIVYAGGLAAPSPAKHTWTKEKMGLSDNITSGINELIQLREEVIARKTTAARDHAAIAGSVVGWLTIGGVGIAVFLAGLHARSVSHPLKRLAQELRFVGKGEFRRYLDLQSPEEIGELARAFNWMASRLAMLDDMKEDFIAHVSHELRTPLTAILEGTTLLREEIPGPLTASQREVVDVVRNHGERLFRFLSSVLDLSKMEAGMMEYLRTPSDLHMLLDRSVQTVQLSAQRKQIQLEILCPSPLPLLSIDEVRIQQVLDNLLNNAMKFTPPGGIIRITASLNASSTGQDMWVEVRVADTGTGIPAEEVERVFDKFYQSSQHRGGSNRGTGLGLAIARHIVEAHGGRIWAESQWGKGSTFIVILPADDSHQEGRSAAAVETLVDAPAALPVSTKGERHAV